MNKDEFLRKCVEYTNEIPYYFADMEHKWKPFEFEYNKLGEPKTHFSFVKYLCENKNKFNTENIEWFSFINYSIYSGPFRYLSIYFKNGNTVLVVFDLSKNRDAIDIGNLRIRKLYKKDNKWFKSEIFNTKNFDEAIKLMFGD